MHTDQYDDAVPAHFYTGRYLFSGFSQASNQDWSNWVTARVHVASRQGARWMVRVLSQIPQ